MKTGILVIGGGVSGMIAAIEAARRGERVLVLEKMDAPGKRLLATGNGRCNLMNRGPLKYYGEPEFAFQVMGSEYLETLTTFWHSIGVPVRYDADGRGYPYCMMASSVLDSLRAEMKRCGIPVITGTKVISLTAKNNHPAQFLAITEKGETISSDRVILATGGAAQQKLGGNTDAWEWIRAFGHSMEAAKPALVPLKAEKKAISGLAGQRVKCRLETWTLGRKTHEEKGEVLFTETGISGICVMQSARFIVPGESECLLDLVSGFYPEEQTLLGELQYRRRILADEGPAELLRGLVSTRAGYAVCKQAGIPLRGEHNLDLTDDQLKSISRTLQHYRIPITGTEGLERAQVMAGGVHCGQVHPANLESRIIPGLYLTGELLNVDGDCGGYNLMFAAMCGLRAGRNKRH